MRYLQISCIIIYLAIHTLCNPIPKKSLYESIIEKCPSVSTIEGFQEERIFKSCSSWSETDAINITNIKNVQCTLYFASFTNYCTHNKFLNVTISQKSIAKALQTPLKEFCDYAQNITYKKLGTYFSTEEKCEQLCADDLRLAISITCGISFYFGHLHTDLSIQNNEQGKKETGKVAAFQPVLKQDFEKKKLPADNNDAENAPLITANASPTTADASPAAENLAQSKTENEKPEGDTEKVEAAAANPAVSKSAVGNSGVSNLAVGNSGVSNLAVSKPAVSKPAVSKPAVSDSAVNNPGVDTPKTEQNVNDPQDVAPVDVPVKTKDSGQQVNPPQIDSKEKTENLGTNIDANIDALEPVNNAQEVPEEDAIEEAEDAAVMDPSLTADKSSKPIKTDDEPISYTSDVIEGGDSYFFTYFMIFCIIFVVGYVCYHNKQKILALILEGRKGRRPSRGRRPNSANYHKLDSNLEEAISSSCKKNTSNVIY